MADPDFENLNHLQNPGHLLLNAPSMLPWKILNYPYIFMREIYDDFEWLYHPKLPFNWFKYDPKIHILDNLPLLKYVLGISPVF